MLQLENPIRVIERSGYTRGDNEPDGWELLHRLICKGLHWNGANGSVFLDSFGICIVMG